MNARLAALADLRFRLGGHLELGTENPLSGACTALPTGLPGLDGLLGGLPRGRLTDLVGRGSSGKLTLLLGALRGVLLDPRAGGAALVDLGGTTFPSDDWAAGRLLVVRPRSLPQALRALDVLTSSGAFAIVALEASGTSSRFVPEGVGVRAARLARETGCAVVACADRPLFGTHACLRLELTARPDGTLRVEARKNRQGPLGGVDVPWAAFPFARPVAVAPRPALAAVGAA